MNFAFKNIGAAFKSLQLGLQSNFKLDFQLGRFSKDVFARAFFVLFFSVSLTSTSFLFSQETSEQTEQQEYSIAGKVSNSKGELLSKVEIFVRSGAQVVLQTESSTEGEFSFTLKRTGIYSIFFSSGGAKQKTVILNIIPGRETEPLDVVLEDIAKLDIVVADDFGNTRGAENKVLQVTSFDNKAIEERAINDVSDLSGSSANVYALDTGSSSSTYLALRGITSVGTLDPVVVFYVDGVAQFQSINNPLQLANIESVQIYKGAQTTLFGRNSLAGVIDIRTKRSEKRLGGNASIEFNSKLKHSYTLNFSFPIFKEMIFGKMGGFFSMHDGDFYNATLGKRVDGHLNYSAYGEFDFLITPSFEFTLLGKYEAIDEEAFPYVGGGTTFEENLRLARNYPYNVNYNIDNRNQKNTGEGTVKLRYENDYLALISATTYQNLTNSILLDTDFSESDLGSTSLSSGINLITEELKLFSTEITSRYFNWTVGIFTYYQNNKSKTSISVNGDLITTLDFDISHLDVKQDNFGIAFFGNANIGLSEKVTLVLGSRFDVDTKKVVSKRDLEQFDGSTNVGFSFNRQFVDYFYTPKLAFQFQLAPEFSVFTSVTRGFRSGGINTFVGDEDNLTYQKETSWQTELGAKVNNEGRRGNFSLFYTYWQNQQVNVFFDGDFFQFGLFNAKKSYAFGLEMETVLPIAYGFSFDNTMGFSFSRFLEYTTPGGVEITNTAQPYIPENTFSFALNHEYTINFKSFDFTHINRVEYRYIQEIFYDPENTIRGDGYGLLNYTTTVRIYNVSLSVWFKNLLDTRYVAFSLPFGGIIPVRLGDPFTFGSRISVYF